MVVQGNIRRHWSERAILLGPNECQSGELLLDLGELLLDLGKLLGHSSNEHRLQMCKEEIRTRKYLGKKLLPPH